MVTEANDSARAKRTHRLALTGHGTKVGAGCSAGLASGGRDAPARPSGTHTPATSGHVREGRTGPRVSRETVL